MNVEPTSAVTGTPPSASQTDQPNAGQPKAVPRDKVSIPPRLSAQQQVELQHLVMRDREVRAHEAAHQAAGGSLAAGASFSYEQGPDGRSYAVGGEVSISLGGGRTPQEIIARARQVRQAALAPADPSGQDLRVAAAAQSLETQASFQLVQQRFDHAHAKEPCAACRAAVGKYASG